MTDIMERINNAVYVVSVVEKNKTLIAAKHEIERLRAIINQYGMDTRNVPIAEHMRFVAEQLEIERLTLQDVPVTQMREAARAWRDHSRGYRSLHDRIDEFINEIEQLRATVVVLADKVHVHLLPDGTYTAVAAGPPHPVKDHGYE
jgi:hypothetical protein